MVYIIIVTTFSLPSLPLEQNTGKSTYLPLLYQGLKSLQKESRARETLVRQCSTGQVATRFNRLLRLRDSFYRNNDPLLKTSSTQNREIPAGDCCCWSVHNLWTNLHSQAVYMWVLGGTLWSEATETIAFGQEEDTKGYPTFLLLSSSLRIRNEFLGMAPLPCTKVSFWHPWKLKSCFSESYVKANTWKHEERICRFEFYHEISMYKVQMSFKLRKCHLASYATPVNSKERISEIIFLWFIYKSD